jgi:hypothetical protein
LTPSLYRTISYVNESRRWQTFSLFALSELVYSLFALSELVCTKNVFYPILLFPTFSPQASSPLERSRQKDRGTDFFTPRYLSSFFFPLSARGPTRRRNSTGLAELWGGWPIELGNTILVKLWELVMSNRWKDLKCVVVVVVRRRPSVPIEFPRKFISVLCIVHNE